MWVTIDVGLDIWWVGVPDPPGMSHASQGLNREGAKNSGGK